MQSFKNAAFTLAEVMITLGIIGIAAAMTLPSLIEKYQKKQTVTQLKKVYTILQQASQRAETDFGSVQYWNYLLSAKDFSNLYIKPFYKIVQDYDNITFPSEYKIYCRTGEECMVYGDFNNASKFIITDGVLLAVKRFGTANQVAGVTIIVDINGFKKPNKYGRDVFLFSLQVKGGVLPYGTGQLTGDTTFRGFDRNFLMNGEWRACKYDGLFCAALIMTDNWEIKDDYPW